MRRNIVINTALIITTIVLTVYIFFHNQNRVDIAPSKNVHLTNSNKITIANYKDIDSVKTKATYYLDVIRQTHRNGSTSAAKDNMALGGIIICQLALLFLNLRPSKL